jgi:hypothetical protein|tara:strand:+ start:355 stop:498 length:144 start_codon:yes stop_codon:yes gene_type:complete
MHNEPNRALADSLANSGVEVHQIDDVQGRNHIRNAIHSGALLGRSIL